MKLPIPKCPVCDKIGEYKYSRFDYTTLVCNDCDIAYNVGGTIPDHIPKAQIKMYIKKCMDRGNS